MRIREGCGKKPGKKVPQSARLRAGGGSNRYLGNAQIEVTLTSKVLPVLSVHTFLITRFSSIYLIVSDRTQLKT